MIKYIEIRDRMTFIPAIAVELNPKNEQEIFLYRKAGYPLGERFILLTRLGGGDCNYDIYAWHDRTFKNAHSFIIENWDSIKSGDVVDVEYNLGETTTKKESEAL